MQISSRILLKKSVSFNDKSEEIKVRKSKSLCFSGFTILCSMFIINTSQAVLIDMGGGLIYDNVLDVTWLQDANYAHTTDYEFANEHGHMTWEDAIVWAENLTYFDSERGVTYDDWRLPSTINDFSSTINDLTTIDDVDVYSSEMAYMYYVNLGYPFQPWDGRDPIRPDAPPINDFFPDLIFRTYWSETVYNENNAWTFHYHFGTQIRDSQGEYHYAWAVRDGNVANDVVSVPLPTSIMLWGIGLVGLAGLNLRRKRKVIT